MNIIRSWFIKQKWNALRSRALKIKALWARTSNQTLLATYHDTISWLQRDDLPAKLRKRIRKRLDKRIIPEMERRGIDGKPIY